MTNKTEEENVAPVMTKEKAEAILKNLPGSVSFLPTRYTAEELEAVAWHIRNTNSSPQRRGK